MDYENISYDYRDGKLTPRPASDKPVVRNMTQSEIASAVIMRAKAEANSYANSMAAGQLRADESRAHMEAFAMEAFAALPATVSLDFALPDHRIQEARSAATAAYQAAAVIRDQSQAAIDARLAELQEDLEQLTRTIPALYRTDRAAAAHALDRQLVLKVELAYLIEERAAAEVTYYRTVLPVTSALAAEAEAIQAEFEDQVKALNSYIDTAKQSLWVNRDRTAGDVFTVKEIARQSTIRLQEAHYRTDQAHQASIGAIKPLAG